jgi:hypothetical protein
MAQQTYPFTRPPTKIISWLQEVLYNDPLFNQERVRPIIYEFSNGRTFVADPNVYTD